MIGAPPVLPSTPNFIGMLDSITQGTDGTSMQAQLALLNYGSQYKQINVAMAGRRADTMTVLYPQLVYPYATLFTGTKWVTSILGGNNDIGQSQNTSQVFSALQTLWNDCLGNGCSLVIKNTIMPSIFFTTPANVVRNTVNALILADTTPKTVTLDLASLFPDASNTSIYIDGTHFTALGQQMWAGYVNTILASA